MAGLLCRQYGLPSLLVDPTIPLDLAAVGKTHLARVLAEEILGSRGRLLRLNMADYASDGAAAVLFGQPGGDGDSRRGTLARLVRGCQFGVLLLPLRAPQPLRRGRLLRSLAPAEVRALVRASSPSSSGDPGWSGSASPW